MSPLFNSYAKASRVSLATLLLLLTQGTQSPAKTPAWLDPVLVTFFLSPDWAPTYGPEFEFTSHEIVRDWPTDRPKFFAIDNKTLIDGREGVLQKKLVAAIRLKCQTTGRCKVYEDLIAGEDQMTDSLNNPIYFLRFEDNLWFRIETDPGCVEVQMTPSTTDQLYDIEKRARHFIFETAFESGLIVEDGGNGHFNIGIESAFGPYGLALLSYIADYANFPELSLGALGRNLDTAPPINGLSLLQRRAFEALLRKVRAQRLANPDLSLSTEEVAQKIAHDVYYQSRTRGFNGYHDQAISLSTSIPDAFEYKRLKDLQRAEHRDNFAQPTFRHFILRGELFEWRMRHLVRQGLPLEYKAPERFQARHSKQALVDALFRYVGADIERFVYFRPLLPNHLQNIWPTKAKSAQPCDSALLRNVL
ncbi:MAG: hypothetical protein AB7N80_07745 [Bdellovibrionales bacterium]